MNKATIKTLAVVIALFFAITTSSNAQLPGGAFGIGTVFTPVNFMLNDYDYGKPPLQASLYATGHFALMDNIDLCAGLNYQSTSYDFDEDSNLDEPKDQSSFGLMAGLRFFLAKGKDVSPYVGGMVTFNSGPNNETSSGDYTNSSFGVSGVFGGQVMLAKNFAVYGHASLGMLISSRSYDAAPGFKSWTNSTTTLSLSGSGVGAVFYF